MPVVNLPVALLRETLRREVPAAELAGVLQRLGCDVEGLAELRRLQCRRCGAVAELSRGEEVPLQCEACGGALREEPEAAAELPPVEVIRMELLPNRPDLFDPGGLGRALRLYLEVDRAPPVYEARAGEYTVTVDPALSRPESHRPHLAAAVVRGLSLDPLRLRSLMKLQENLHWALGRDRKFTSIGVYDLGKLQGRAFRYRAVTPTGVRFPPLGETAPRTPAEILRTHVKGRAFRHLLEGFTAYPLLEDEAGGVLSLPPIINSEPTRVTAATRELFVDVTGTSAALVEKTLAVLVTSLLELHPGARLETVRILTPAGERVTPDLRPETHRLEVAAAARWLGLSLTPAATARLLVRMGFQVPEVGPTLTVLAPPYRADLLHPVDLMEDVAIAYGFDGIRPRLVPTMTVGGGEPVEERSAAVRRVLTGLGFLEVMSLPLTSAPARERALRGWAPPALEILNPIHDESGTPLKHLRTDLLPGLFEALGRYRGEPLPQRLFEVGDVTRLDPAAETGAREERRAAAVVRSAEAGFAQARALAAALLRETGWGLEAEPADLPFYVPGRGARAFGRRGGERRPLGHFGEIHPEVLERFRLTHPVAALEVSVEALGGGGLEIPMGHRTFL